jgi:hypothetical protein
MGATPRSDATARRRPVAALVAAAIALAACADATTSTIVDDGRAGMPDTDRCRSPQPAASPSIRGNFEEANLVAAGEMFRTYGLDADPVREQVTGDLVDVRGEPAWKLDGTYAVTVDGSRRSDTWMLWVGFDGDAFSVLCAVGPDDVPWPPAGDR